MIYYDFIPIEKIIYTPMKSNYKYYKRLNGRCYTFSLQVSLRFAENLYF